MSAAAQVAPRQSASAPVDSTEQALTTPSWDRLALSFEVIPPRNDADAAKLDDVIAALAAYRPDYIAVTSSQRSGWLEGTTALIRRIVDNTRMMPLAHLAATSGTKEEVEAGIQELIDAGVRGLLALRGDLPQGETRLPDTHLQHATDLQKLIAEVESRQSYRFAAGRVSVGVACYPAGHAESANFDEDIDVLLAKQRLGADFAITQLFFDPEDYARFVKTARLAGVTIPLIPGIMPMTSLKRVERMGQLSGLEVPHRLSQAMVEAGPEGEYDVGMGMTVQLAKQALAAGAGGLHIYTHNNIDVTVDLLDRIST